MSGYTRVYPDIHHDGKPAGRAAICPDYPATPSAHTSRAVNNLPGVAGISGGLARGGIHHDTVQPGRDRGIAVTAGGAVGLLPEDVCVPGVPGGFFDHVDVDPAQ